MLLLCKTGIKKLTWTVVIVVRSWQSRICSVLHPARQPFQRFFQDQAAMGRDSVDRDSVFSNYKSVFSRQFAVSLVVEFIGVMFFQILGGSAKKGMEPWVNAMALAVWIYTAANISGGHLNPAVTISMAICGFFPVLHSIVYVTLQILGAMLGAVITAFLIPGASLQMGDGGPGCFDRSVIAGISDKQVMWWECIMTFTLISCVYACGVAKPGHGSHTPLVVGFALFCCAASGGQYTGGALNPARVLGPLAAFGCGEDICRRYLAGQCLAALFAMSVFAFVSGLGPLNPWMAKRALQLSFPEAVYLWITGSPPSRLQKTGRENINDFMSKFQKFHSEDSEDDVAETKEQSSFLERFFGVKHRGKAGKAVADSESQAIA